MAKRKKLKTKFEGWHWQPDVAQQLLTKLCEHGAQTMIDEIRDSSKGTIMLGPYGKKDTWVVSCRICCKDVGVDVEWAKGEIRDDEIINVEVPLGKLIADTDGVFDSREEFDAFKAEIMNALAQLERSVSALPPTEEEQRVVVDEIHEASDNLQKKMFGRL